MEIPRTYPLEDKKNYPLNELNLELSDADLQQRDLYFTTQLKIFGFLKSHDFDPRFVTGQVIIDLLRKINSLFPRKTDESEADYLSSHKKVFESVLKHVAGIAYEEYQVKKLADILKDKMPGISDKALIEEARYRLELEKIACAFKGKVFNFGCSCPE